MKTFDTCLGPLAVRDIGEGAPVVLWHSAYLDGRSWDRILPLLPSGRRYIVIDGPDHGDSVGPAGRSIYDLELCADAALQVLEELGVEQVDWVGNAWGGHTGVVLAARKDPRVRSLAVLCAPMQALESPAKVWILLAIAMITGTTGFVPRTLQGVMLAR